MRHITDAMLRMLKARETVARRNVFFSSVLYHARMIESPAQEKATWTDGANVYFNPNQVTAKENSKFTEGELLFQTLRCAFNHVGRRKHRDKKLWNAASEFALTPVVRAVYPLPDSALYDPRFVNKSTEEIYKILEEENPPEDQNKKGKPQPGDGSPSPGMGEMQEPDENDPEAQEQQEEAQRDWDRVAKLGADKAIKAGTMPGYLKRLIDELWPAEKIDWRSMLEDMIREAKSKVSGSWSRPNRKMLGHGLVLPGWTNDTVFRVVLCLDSSGSVTEKQLADMKSEAMSLLDQQLCTNVTMISTDTRVCNMVDVSTSEEARTFDLGNHGGGTNFKPAMAAVAKLEDVAGCIFFTDMDTNDFGENPGIPVVWVDWVSSGRTAPYGVTTTFK